MPIEISSEPVKLSNDTSPRANFDTYKWQIFQEDPDNPEKRKGFIRQNKSSL